MPALFWAGIAFAQLASAPRPIKEEDLRAAAASSSRPVECTPRSVRRGDRVWKQAREPGVERYCDSLARGYARLRRDPKASLEAANAAEKALPGRAAPQVLRARTLLALGQSADAWAAFGRARAISRRSVDVPATLHDFAIAAVRTGHFDDAARAYRALVPRAGLLDEGVRRQRVFVEAASVVMGLGAESLDEAIGFLTEARRQGSAPGVSGFVLGTLALALDRQDQQRAARSVAAEAGAPAGLLRQATSAGKATDRALPALPEGELYALIAVLVESTDVELAREQWRAFLASPAGRGPWAEHAKKKLAGLEGRKAP